jgi:glycosidase
LDLLNETEPLDQTAGVRSHRGAIFKHGEYVTSYDEDVARSRGNEAGYKPKFHQYDRRIGDRPGEWDNPWAVENYNLENLADLDQDNPQIDAYMKEAHEFWLNRFPDLAGYRMDTIKHIKASYWERFSERLYKSHPRAEVFGEYYGGGPQHELSREFYKKTRMSMIDFSFRNAVRAVFAEDAPMSRITGVWRDDPKLIDARSLITYLDSHDEARLRGEVNGLSLKQMRQSIALWLLARGVPCIYYGMEQDLFEPNHTGDPARSGDPYNRPMMREFNEQHPLFKMMQSLIAIRKKHPSIRSGVTHVIHESADILGFERVLDDDVVFFATSKNAISGSDRFYMQGSKLRDGRYRDPLSNLEYDVRGGKFEVNMRNGDVIVLTNASATH